ncbi:hypothetical protein C1645_585541 [Glomus cerebriforme]|uniref:Uncharacterized protein n=1 Tax=Glomus cerebriforme TaxID=658196 RepID=A0A397S7U5_9GLOM|nr:hypothetical protein C1645_585541 [Glomus cerebriforme]
MSSKIITICIYLSYIYFLLINSDFLLLCQFLCCPFTPLFHPNTQFSNDIVLILHCVIVYHQFTLIFV